jgi:hypothetical protein
MAHQAKRGADCFVVKPETLIGWHRKLFWRWKARLGRPRIPENLPKLILLELLPPSEAARAESSSRPAFEFFEEDFPELCSGEDALTPNS